MGCIGAGVERSKKTSDDCHSQNPGGVGLHGGRNATAVHPVIFFYWKSPNQPFSPSSLTVTLPLFHSPVSEMLAIV